MKDWILILTIITSGHGAEIAPIPGFASLEVCMSAARKWGENASRDAVAGERYSATCVSTTDAAFNNRRDPAPPKKKTNL